MPNSIIISVENEVETLLEACPCDEEMLLDRLNSLEFTQTDADAMQLMDAELVQYQAEINLSFLSYLNSTYKKTLLSEPGKTEALLKILITNFSQLTRGKYNHEYIRTRYSIGIIHRRSGLPYQDLIAIYGKFKTILRPIIWRFCNDDIDALIRFWEALSKIIYLDVGITLDAYCQGEHAALSHIQKEYSSRTEQLVAQQNYDQLTGLPNRQFFKDQIVRMLQNDEKKSPGLAILKLGLDHFKTFNDLEGYETGDLILTEIGQRLQAYLDKDDLISYWGGDSFTIALLNTAHTKNIDRICNEICILVSQPLQSAKKILSLTCSIGIALYPHDCTDLTSLTRYSNSAMNRAKEIGGNRFQFFNQKLDARLNDRLSLANEILNAIETSQFCLHYQPVADLESGEIVSMEALIRWQHPNRGMMQPVQFIVIAEEFSLINQLGDWVIKQACIDIREWRSKGFIVPRIAINVSPRQLLEPRFSRCLLATLNEYDVEPEKICLEITESTLLHHSAGMEKLLKQLKAKNFYLAMDDFGTGYSALQYLKHYPFDCVKIDQSFVRNILDNSNDAAIASAVISMSHSMGTKVIAEGVETELQCQYFSQTMCDQMQGYYLSRPVPAYKAGEYLSEKLTLPEHARRVTKKSRNLLLVDDEPNILAALKRLFRQDDYTIFTAGSGAAGMEMLAKNSVDVIISDQRMPNMTGVEFLRQAKIKYPTTMRIVLSGYTELQSITDAINEGSIYKFLTKPWDDHQLRQHISDAFRQKELFDENRNLGFKIQTANQQLAMANRQLADLLEIKEKQLSRDEISLDIAREALQHIPVPMLGIDDDSMIAFVNTAAEELLFNHTEILGADIEEILPSFNRIAATAVEGGNFSLNISGYNYLVSCRTMGLKSKSSGKIITFFVEE